MNDKFTVDLSSLEDVLSPKKAYRLSDVKDRIEKVAYDIVRFRDNKDTDQLWRIEERSDGPVIIALYNDDGSLISESKSETDWDAIPDKKAMNIYYKGEPIVSLSSKELGIPETEFDLVKRWLPNKLSSDKDLQKSLFSKLSSRNINLIVNRFPELTKVAQDFATFQGEQPIAGAGSATSKAPEDFVPPPPAPEFKPVVLSPQMIQLVTQLKVVLKTPELKKAFADELLKG